MLSDSDAGSSEEPIDEPPEQHLDKTPGRKRQALEGMTNAAKRQRAPRAAQSSVAQVLQDYGPRYRTRRSALAEGSSAGGDGKENGSQEIEKNLRVVTDCIEYVILSRIIHIIFVDTMITVGKSATVNILSTIIFITRIFLIPLTFLLVPSFVYQPVI